MVNINRMALLGRVCCGQGKRPAFQLFVCCLLGAMEWGTVDAASYQVRFEADWSAASHPGAVPDRNAHFSTPIGVTHNAAITFWAPGELASAGLEGVAETGSVRLILQEFNAAIEDGRALGTVLGGTFSSPGVHERGFEVVPEFSRFTFLSMIAPSPDWFVGVHGLELRNEAGWIPEITLPLYPYDAGTEQGESLQTANPATVPAEVIRRLDLDGDSVFAGLPPLGRLIFKLLPACDLDFSGTCDAQDLNGQDGLYSVGDLTVGTDVVPGENSRFDLNRDQRVDVADLESWLAESAAYNGFAGPYLRGDSNLDGVVGFGDFIALSRGFGSGREWTDGNYNGDDQTDFLDFLLLSRRFGKSLPAAASVPEPHGSAGWFVVVGLLVMRRPGKSRP